jgi:hypothetical protein
MKRLAVAVAIFSLFGCSGDDDLGKDAGQDVVVVDSTTPDAANDAADATRDVASDVTDASDASDAPILTNPTSIEIQAVRVAAETALDGGVANLPIDDATVTYVKALVGNDPAGFFVQAELTGPAIFVAVDPQTLTPSPTPGDQVSFVVTGAHVVSGAHSVTAITTFTRSAQNIALAPLLQDVSGAADVVSNIDGYESEYVTFGATVKSRFQPADTGFVEAQVETTALTGNQALNLRLRVPSGVKTAIGVDNDCTVTLVGIMDRLGGVAQPSGWVAGDFTNTLCNPPKVKTASASSVTSIVVTFDRDINGASLASNGSQFTFDNGLTASAAQLTSSAQITVTTASQTQNTTYHVTVDSSLTDVLGKGIDTNANQATFTSFNTVAALQLNELNPNITGSLDLVELLALTSGNINGITLEQDIASKTVLATMPSLAVTQGDFIVVHLGATTASTETTTKGDCTDTSCYSGAWDVKGGTTGITYSGRVIVVRAPSNGAIQDTAPFYQGTVPASFSGDVMSIQGLGAWLPADCSGNPCNTNTLAETVSVSWGSCGSSATGNSVARKANADTSYAADWAVGAQSFGATNP